MNAPKKICAWPDRGRRESVTGRWSCNTYSSDLTEAYILAAEHERLLSEARNKALEDAAACCENEADKCDDAVKWGGERRYIQNCMAASFAMRNRAAAIRAMKGKSLRLISPDQA